MRKQTADKRSRSKKQTYKSSKARLASMLQMPEAAFYKSASVEITGNHEAVVEGCKGVLVYDENVIKLNMGKYSLRFTGQSLEMKCFENESLTISGLIVSVDFGS